MLIVGIMDEVDIECGILLCQEVAYHLSTIACDHYQLIDVSSQHSINSTLQQGALTNLQ